MTRPTSAVVSIVFFAKARELSGLSEAQLRVPAHIAVEELLAIICENFSLNSIRSSLFLALNEDYCVDPVVQLKDGDEIAVIPPISGG